MMSRLLTCLRFLLALAGAALLLYVFSYPDSVLPPDPAVADVEGLTVYDFKPVIWLAPLLLLELICAAGPHRNRVWFGSLLTVFIAGLLAWPPLLASRPELVHPMLEFEDGKLAVGLGYMALLLAASALFRLVLLDFLFSRPEEARDESGHMEATVLDPSTARTVKEIAADPVRVNPRFLFGDADLGLIERFHALMAKLMRRSLARRLLLLAALLAGAAWFFLYPQPNEQEALQRDLAAMYETDASGLRATPRAVHAAYRVMRYVHEHESFAGFDAARAEQWLHLDRATPAYRRLLRDETDRPLASVDDVFEVRTRFLTVTDGRREAVLFVRTDASGEHINIAEAADAGWNAEADEQRRILGADWNINYR